MNVEEAYARLTNSCARKEMCKQDVYKWMFKFNVPKDKHDEIIEKLVKEGFVDEYRFSCAFANDNLKYSKWGERKIAYYLRSKNIDESNIEAALAQLDSQLYEEIKNKLAEAKRRVLPADDPNVEAKVASYLYGRGF